MEMTEEMLRYSASTQSDAVLSSPGEGVFMVFMCQNVCLSLPKQISGIYA